MADRIVIYDPELQLSAVVDTESMRALGPVGGGPNARGELSQFVATMPDAVWNLNTYDLAQAYMQFWGENFAGLYEEPESGDGAAVVEPTDPGHDAARLAEHTASATGDGPPPPQPADPDMEADSGEAEQVAAAVDPSSAPSSPSGAAGADTAESSAPVAESGAGAGSPAGEQYAGPCFACQGTGNVPGATEGSTATCNLCKGTGQLPVATAAS